ncbi:MAG: DUF485 domain-containing protein [Pseudonocardiales bacterium]|nr:DUF485 domain-containing protein [Pseudonocardiales bacterium]
MAAHSLIGEDNRVTVNVALYERVQSSPEFVGLRRRRRLFVIPVSVAFALWYAGYLVLAAYAPGFMAIKLLGNITVALVGGVVHVLSILLIATAYVRYMNRTIDPGAARIRGEVEDIWHSSGLPDQGR